MIHFHAYDGQLEYAHVVSIDTHMHTHRSLSRQPTFPWLSVANAFAGGVALSMLSVVVLLLVLDAMCLILHILVIKGVGFGWLTSLKALSFNVTVSLQGLCLAAGYNPVRLAMCRYGFPVLLCITLAVHRRHGLYLQVFCSKVSPNCGACPLQASCEYALNNGKRLQPQPMKPFSRQSQVSCTFSTGFNGLNRPQPI